MVDLRKAIILFSALFVLCLADICNAKVIDNNFTGRWCWDKSDEISTFTLFISKISNIYKGGYLNVALSGNRIDDSEDSFSFKASDNNSIKTKFKAGISGKIGVVELKILNNKKIEWHVLRTPLGDFYAPYRAVLHRC